MKNSTKNNLQKGKTAVIKSSGMDVRSIPQPIPVEELNWDLEFDFPRKNPILHVGETSQVEYKLKTRDNLNIRLKRPIIPKVGTSRRFQQNKFEEVLDNSESE